MILKFSCGKSILVDHTSLSHCVAGMLQFLEKYLLLDILRPTSRIGSLALTNTGSHPCMCQEGESLNQLTLMVPLKKKNDCIGATGAMYGVFF